MTKNFFKIFFDQIAIEGVEGKIKNKTKNEENWKKKSRKIVKMWGKFTKNFALHFIHSRKFLRGSLKFCEWHFKNHTPKFCEWKKFLQKFCDQIGMWKVIRKKFNQNFFKINAKNLCERPFFVGLQNFANDKFDLNFFCHFLRRSPKFFPNFGDLPKWKILIEIVKNVLEITEN